MMAFSRQQTFSASLVCEIITGDDGEVDFMFPGSGDLDALKLSTVAVCY